MRSNSLKKCLPLLCLFFSLLCPGDIYGQTGQTPDQKEFRGIWVATINNIDWPSAPGLPVEQQKKELTDLIEQIEKYKLNAVFFQVRAAADAFYASSTEPWSYFLSGKQGRPTEPFFDPLAYAIEVCHSKGIELHAWFNPFRVRNAGYYDLAPNSFASKYPQYQHDYDNKRFFDPGFPQVRAHMIKVILEVVRKYNIDAVLLDDYFYPYPVRGKNFPDSKTFARYGKEFYPKRLKDWRRNNINSFISGLHDGIKSIKPNLKLGISPFGIWRTNSDDPNGSPLVRGTTSYDDLYADVYKWLSEDWIDFVIPQLYWEQGNRYGDFNAMAKWWNEHSFGKPLYLGQALYKSTGSGSSWNNPTEISDQISLMRKYGNIRGFAFFSASHLSKLPEDEKRKLAERLGNRADSSQVPIPAEENLQLAAAVVSAPELMVNEKSFDSIISLKSGWDRGKLEIAGKLTMRRQHREWQISWSPAVSVNSRGQELLLLSYLPKGENGCLKKIFHLEGKEQIIHLKDADYKPQKAVYVIASLNEKDRLYSNLFRIKRKKMVYVPGIQKATKVSVLSPKV